jgi:hypothetical protein
MQNKPSNSCDNNIHKLCFVLNSTQAHQSIANARVKAIRILGGKCVVCGLDDTRILQINHKNGGGNLEYKAIGSGTIYRRITSDPDIRDNYDVRCANHNLLYEYERDKNKRLTQEERGQIINMLKEKIRVWRHGKLITNPVQARNLMKEKNETERQRWLEEQRLEYEQAKKGDENWYEGKYACYECNKIVNGKEERLRHFHDLNHTYLRVRHCRDCNIDITREVLNYNLALRFKYAFCKTCATKRGFKRNEKPPSSGLPHTN